MLRRPVESARLQRLGFYEDLGMRALIATFTWMDGLGFGAAIAVGLGAWWVVFRSSVWAIRRLLASDPPRPAVIALVAVAPVAMFGGGWLIYGMYRLGWWPSRGRTRTTDDRLRSWLVAALVFWLGAAALVELIATAIATTPQANQNAWGIGFRLLPLAPAVTGSIAVAINWLRGLRGPLLALRVAQVVFWTALALLAFAGPKPD